jgi:hypothetical protein
MFGFSGGLFTIYFIWMPLLIIAAIVYGLWGYDLQKKSDSSEKEGK